MLMVVVKANTRVSIRFISIVRLQPPPQEDLNHLHLRERHLRPRPRLGPCPLLGTVLHVASSLIIISRNNSLDCFHICVPPFSLSHTILFPILSNILLPDCKIKVPTYTHIQKQLQRLEMFVRSLVRAKFSRVWPADSFFQPHPCSHPIFFYLPALFIHVHLGKECSASPFFNCSSPLNTEVQLLDPETSWVETVPFGI